MVGVDESEGAAEALRWAVREAALHDTEVTALMAWGFLDQHHAIVAERFDPSYGEEDALEALRAIVTATVGDQATSAVRARVVCELPARALLDAVDGDDLLVLGARGLGGFRGLLVGSVSQHCLHHVSVPTAIVRATGDRDREAPTTERVVVGVDGSEMSHRALRWALAEGRARKGTVEVVNAWQVLGPGYPPLTNGVLDPAIYEDASRAVLDDALVAAGADDFDVAVERTSTCGGAAGSILDAAEEADLVVLGSRGLGAVKGMLLGSVTMQVTHHAPCPVVVVP